MLEKTVDDRYDTHVLTVPGHAWHQATDPADEKVDLHPGPAGPIERLDHTRVHQRVHLGHDRGRPAFLGVLGLAVDHADRPAQVVHRRDHELAPLQRRSLRLDQLLHAGHAETGQQIHELRGVGTEVRIAGEEVDVGVETARHRVVVPGREMDVASQLSSLAPHDEADLAMGFVADDAVDHLHARFLERSRPGDVLPLVEAGLQLDDRGDLLARSRGRGECGDDRRAGVRPIERLFDGHDARVLGGRLDKLDDGRERVVRPVQQKVAPTNDGEDVVRRGQCHRHPRIERRFFQLRIGDLRG
jgi:hypothetical protein